MMLCYFCIYTLYITAIFHHLLSFKQRQLKQNVCVCVCQGPHTSQRLPVSHRPVNSLLHSEAVGESDWKKEVIIPHVNNRQQTGRGQRKNGVEASCS